MFCPNCGKEANSNFCQYCGEKLSSNADLSNEDNKPSHSEINMDSINEAFKGKKIEMMKHVKSLMGISLVEAKNLVDDYFAHKPKSGKNFWADTIAQGNEINAKKAIEKQERMNHIKQMDKDGIAYCPKCYSTSLSGNKKGFGVGKAVVGAYLTGGIGLVAGNIGAKKIKVTCLKCGNQFWAGK